MDSSEPLLPKDVTDRLVEAAREAYDTALDLHDPSRGSNATTFGIGSANFGVFELMKLAKDQPDVFQIARAGRMIRLRADGTEVALYKVGRFPETKIEQAFPTSKNAAYPIRDNMQRYMFDDEPESQPATRHLILAHIGNGKDGLLRLVLCQIGNVMDSFIVSWQRTQELYDQSSHIVAAPEMPAEVLQAPTEVVKDFELPLKKKPRKADGDAPSGDS